MITSPIFADVESMRRSTFFGQPLGDYTHDELMQMVHLAICRGSAESVRELALLATAFNARRRAEAEVNDLPFISRRKGGGHDTAAR